MEKPRKKIMFRGFCLALYGLPGKMQILQVSNVCDYIIFSDTHKRENEGEAIYKAMQRIERTYQFTQIEK